MRERFLTSGKTKLMSRVDRRFNVLGKVEANAYKLELLGDMIVSASFYVRDLSIYVRLISTLGI